MFITTSYRLRQLFRWMKRSIFKTKNTLPESPKQEIQTSSSTDDVVMKSLDVKAKQEQMKFFEKKNDLRTVHFDLNPVWDNRSLYGTIDSPGDDLYRFRTEEERNEYIKGLEEDHRLPAKIRAIKGQEETYKDEVQIDYNPWEDLERFPLKDYPLTPQEAHKLQVEEPISSTKD